MTDLRRATRPRLLVPALAGLALLAVLLLLLLPGSRRENGTLPPPPPPFLPAPGAAAPATSAPVASAPAIPAPATSGPATSRPATPAPATSSPVTRSPAATGPAARPPSPQVTVTGRYRVVESFPDGFIGEVLVVNSTGSDRGWTVRLRFPDDVGALRTSWVEAAPQASLSTSGDTFTWSSGVPVPARSSVALRFHFARPGSDERPRTCTVNGAACG